MTNMRNAAGRYAEVELATRVASASPHQLIIMLYEGAIQSVMQARTHMQAGQQQEKGLAIKRAMSIIEEGLRLSLDKNAGGEIAQNLDDLYTWMTFRLFFGNAQNDEEKLNEVLTLLGTLKSAWEELDSRESKEKNKSLDQIMDLIPPVERSSPAKTWGHA
ncbi:flagellar export chaperone FliS [Burkholderiaceae bacterium DAT-1]|nr:flagellar export chaperone FliS [Burkholderiaceae bacterium DAT-1]